MEREWAWDPSRRGKWMEYAEISNEINYENILRRIQLMLRYNNNINDMLCDVCFYDIPLKFGKVNGIYCSHDAGGMTENRKISSDLTNHTAEQLLSVFHIDDPNGIIIGNFCQPTKAGKLIWHFAEIRHSYAGQLASEQSRANQITN